MRFSHAMLLAILLAGGAVSPLAAQGPEAQVQAAERARLEASLRRLQTELLRLERLKMPAVDAAIFAKGLDWALRYDRDFTAADLALMEKAVARCGERMAQLQGDKAYAQRRGKLALGYVSEVDGSVQPYGVIVPKNYDPAKPIRLDVVLHGSMRPIGLSELRFMSRFDEGDAENPDPPDVAYIELHPLGRVENCYRWAGETDVFEAIDDVARRYKIDRDRIVLRGMSMGASGTWHLGLKHPDKFVALGPYCGYVDTHKFSETPLPTFVKVGPLPPHQELGLHMLDSIDYAANAGVVPAIACMGEKDVFFDAHVLMGAAMKREGLEMVNLISPGTGHVVDPVTHAEQMRRIAEYADQGINRRPDSLRFVTWTLKYPDCHWLSVLQLKRHYERAELSVTARLDVLEIAEPRNIRQFEVRIADVPGRPQRVRIGRQEVAGTEIRGKEKRLVFTLNQGKWESSKYGPSEPPTGKRPALQGPIDDAFTTPFLCVRGTGTPWHPGVHAYAEASLNRFAEEWRQYFRGELAIKKDTEVTEADAHQKNLILFGDPGSNSWIAKLRDKLPIGWTREAVTLGDETYPAESHLPALIMPNPLSAEPDGSADRYVVLNSGHTFRGAELGKLNYLLFPRWGDWALLNIDPQRPATVPCEEEVVKAGYFDEEWRLP